MGYVFIAGFCSLKTIQTGENHGFFPVFSSKLWWFQPQQPLQGRDHGGLVVLYSAAVRACETAAKWPEALELLQALERMVGVL